MNNIKALQDQLKTLELSATKKCPKCGEEKNRIEDFHRGTSMCKMCKRQADLDRRINAGHINVATAMLIKTVTEMSAKITRMERALNRHNIALSDDENFEETSKNVEEPLKNVEGQRKSLKNVEEQRKSLKNVETQRKSLKNVDGQRESLKKPKLEKTTKSKSDDAADSDEKVVKKPKPKIPDSIAEILRNKNKDKRRK